jgi:hypothetical protein
MLDIAAGAGVSELILCTRVAIAKDLLNSAGKFV